MIIRDIAQAVETEYEKDNALFRHIQDIDPTLKEVQERSLLSDGWSTDRTMRYIGSIPLIEIERNPDLKAALLSGDPKVVDKAMRVYFQTETGRRFVANKLDTGKSGKIKVR